MRVGFGRWFNTVAKETIKLSIISKELTWWGISHDIPEKCSWKNWNLISFLCWIFTRNQDIVYFNKIIIIVVTDLHLITISKSSTPPRCCRIFSESFMRSWLKQLSFDITVSSSFTFEGHSSCRFWIVSSIFLTWASRNLMQFSKSWGRIRNQSKVCLPEGKAFLFHFFYLFVCGQRLLKFVYIFQSLEIILQQQNNTNKIPENILCALWSQWLSKGWKSNNNALIRFR